MKKRPTIPLVEHWELHLISKVTRAFRTEDRDELAAELARRVAGLKSHPPRDIRNWRAYLAKFLYNKAANWVRDERARQRRQVPVIAEESLHPAEETLNLSTSADFQELALGLVNVWNHLDPELQRLWQLLLEEDGNRTAAGRRLHRHRNTVRLWIDRIQTILRRHELTP